MSTLDASVVIAHLKPTDPHREAATRFLAETAGSTHWMNPVNLAEVLVDYARSGRLAEGTRVVGDLGIRERPLPEDAAVRLARLRAETGLRMPGCCVLLTAEQAGTTVATFDERLRSAALHRGLPVVP